MSGTGDGQAVEALLEVLGEEGHCQGDVRSELRGGLAEMRTALADLRSELVRWTFGFWASTLMALVGLLLALRR